MKDGVKFFNFKRMAGGRQSASKREKQTRFLSQAIQLEEAVNPHIIRATMSMVSLAIIAFLIWAGLTNINEVARTPGEVVPQGYQQTVQHFEGGIVKAIHVHEGQVVKEGQPLITLEDSILKDDLERVLVKQVGLELQEERLRAFIEGRRPNFRSLTNATGQMVEDEGTFFEGMRAAREKEQTIIRAQIEDRRQRIEALKSDLITARENLSIAEDMYQRRLSLNEKGYASDIRLLEDKRSLNQAKGELRRIQNETVSGRAEISEYEERLESLSARHRDEALERLSLVATEKAQNMEIVHKLKERMSRLDLRAPARGFVKGLNINTVGAVVQPGQTLLEIVPLDKHLEVAVKISPQDIGHIKVGQPVEVKFSTFDFSRYGSVTGQLEHISATTFAGEKGERYYQGRVLLEADYVGNDPGNRIMPGMTVMADIITGKKTILEYMLRPIHISLKTAFTER